MRVLILSSLYPPNVVGGAERSVAFLAEALASRGNDVTVATTSPGPEPVRAARNGVDVRYLPLRERYWPFEGNHAPHARLAWHVRDVHSPQMHDEIARLLDETGADILHTNTLAGFSVSVWKAAAERGIPIVHTLRDYYLLCPRTTLFRKGRNCDRRCLECRLLSAPKSRPTRLVHALVGNSEYILERHLAHGLFRRATIRDVIYNAYWPPEVEPALEQAHGAPENPRGPLRFGYLGRLAPTKGVEDLLDAVRLLPATGWHLAIAGKGDAAYESRIRERAHGNVEFKGFVTPEPFLQSIDVLVVPSVWNEPLPRTIYEAYAHGVPVISSDRGGSPEIVWEGTTGYLYDARRGAIALAERMASAVRDPGAFRSKRPACLDAATKFAPARTVEDYESVYRRTLDVGGDD